jgi:hypothetical protein
MLSASSREQAPVPANASCRLQNRELGDAASVVEPPVWLPGTARRFLPALRLDTNGFA